MMKLLVGRFVGINPEVKGLARCVCDLTDRLREHDLDLLPSSLLALDFTTRIQTYLRAPPR